MKIGQHPKNSTMVQFDRTDPVSRKKSMSGTLFPTLLSFLPLPPESVWLGARIRQNQIFLAVANFWLITKCRSLSHLAIACVSIINILT